MRQHYIGLSIDQVIIQCRLISLAKIANSKTKLMVLRLSTSSYLYNEGASESSCNRSEILLTICMNGLRLSLTMQLQSHD